MRGGFREVSGYSLRSTLDGVGSSLQRSSDQPELDALNKCFVTTNRQLVAVRRSGHGPDIPGMSRQRADLLSRLGFPQFDGRRFAVGVNQSAAMLGRSALNILSQLLGTPVTAALPPDPPWYSPGTKEPLATACRAVRHANQVPSSLKH